MTLTVWLKTSPCAVERSIDPFASTVTASAATQVSLTSSTDNELGGAVARSDVGVAVESPPPLTDGANVSTPPNAEGMAATGGLLPLVEGITVAMVGVVTVGMPTVGTATSASVENKMHA